MKKIIKIEGMSCGNCVARVQKKLASLGVNAQVDLEKGTATVTCNNDIEDKILATAITDLGFDVTQITSA